MFCPKCGSEIPNESKFCTHCGAQTTPRPAQQSQQNYSANNSSTQQQYNQQQYAQQQQYNGYPMNWYKFLIYFALFASCVLNLISGIVILTGGHYGGYASMVYAYFGGLKALDIIIGILIILLAAFAIVTRFSLAKLQASGPKYLYILYIGSFVVNIIYAIAVGAITGINVFDTSIIIQLIVCVVMVIVNHIYFSKRKSLFVN